MAFYHPQTGKWGLGSNPGCAGKAGGGHENESSWGATPSPLPMPGACTKASVPGAALAKTPGIPSEPGSRPGGPRGQLGGGSSLILGFLAPAT